MSLVISHYQQQNETMKVQSWAKFNMSSCADLINLTDLLVPLL